MSDSFTNEQPQASGMSSMMTDDGDEPAPGAEQWTPTVMYRISDHGEDIYDLNWSPSGQFLLIGMTNNTASIRDTHQGRCVRILKDHHHFVQGVAWDPLEYNLIATQSSDRSISVYHVSSNLDKSVSTTNSHKPSVGRFKAKCIQTLDKFPITGSQEKQWIHRLYYDETLISFFRRLCFSIDGAFLLAPTGLLIPPMVSQTVNEDESSRQHHPSNSGKNCVYLYTRASLICAQGHQALPMGYFGPFDKPAIAVACHPYLFERLVASDPSISTSACTVWANLPYRMIFAIATFNAVYLYDTEQASPIALIKDLHYGTLTDIKWSSRGDFLIVSSTDGYCSMISFHEDETSLGTRYGAPISQPEHTSIPPSMPAIISGS